MPTVVVSGLFGLGGAFLGGMMAIVSARWQSSSWQDGRLAELNLQFQHERILRDEAEKRAVILELIAALERLMSAAVQVSFIHCHGGDGGSWPENECMLDSFHGCHCSRNAILRFVPN